jgi:MFS family permease
MPSSQHHLHGPRHRWKVLGVGVAANASFSVAFSGLPMTAVFMRSGYQLDNTSLGLVLGLMGLGIAISELPWGLLADRWGDRPVLLVGLGATAAALAAMALFAAPAPGHIPGLPLLAAGLLLVGLLGGSVNGASGRAIMSWFQSGERGLAMSIRQTAVPLGGGLGALLLPGLALHAGFAVIYGLLALLCAATAALAWLWLHEPPPHATPQASTSTADADAAAGGPLRDARVWRIVAGIGILCAPQFAVLSFGTVFLHDFAHWGVAAITTAMVSVQVGAMAMRVWSGHWTDRHQNRRAYLRGCTLLSIALFGVLAALVAWAAMQPTMPAATGIALVALLAACGICVSAWHGVAFTELATLAGARRAGTALGMANTSVFAVCFVTPLSIPYLLAWQGWAMVWGVAGLCALVALPLLTVAAPRAAHRAQLKRSKLSLRRST